MSHCQAMFTLDEKGNHNSYVQLWKILCFHWEEDTLNDLLTALLSETISHDLGIYKRHRIAIIDAMVEVQKLAPKPTWVNTCKDLAKYFISRIVNMTNKFDEVKVVF